MAPRSNLAGVESMWLKQGRKPVGLSPEVAWPLMDSTGAGTFRFPEMASGGVQAAPVLDGSQASLKTQDQGSVSDSDTTDCDAGSDSDSIRLRYRRSAEAVAHSGGHGRSIGG